MKTLQCGAIIYYNEIIYKVKWKQRRSCTKCVQHKGRMQRKLELNDVEVISFVRK